ncbi:uncharacterized protein B0T15DRAFT_70962 [Chaetomium strumarium]|uniref:BHLH domain-containing protein n=1 Tax=Chaetomium strumarium TaxID=1170767 RepID=A0AAJ0H4D1_9PEZI|nr:hypothetical protein B0T15DRAFT_70962 [Chaetomium strumarium]
MAAPSSSAAVQPSTTPAAEDEKEKPRLTDKEKKANHIASEQKRRQAIREGFDKLAELVPGMEGLARSEGVVLHGTVDYIRKLLLERRQMIKDLEAKGVAVDMELKMALEMLPEGWLDDVPDELDKSREQSHAEGSSTSPADGSETESAA